MGVIQSDQAQIPPKASQESCWLLKKSAESKRTGAFRARGQPFASGRKSKLKSPMISPAFIRFVCSTRLTCLDYWPESGYVFFGLKLYYLFDIVFRELFLLFKEVLPESLVRIDKTKRTKSAFFPSGACKRNS